MKILHTSDWHIGKSLFGRPLDEDQKFALAQITDHLHEHSYDLLVVAGDVFDRAVPSAESMRQFGQWLGALREFAPRLPIVIIAGNHDNGTRLAWMASLLDEQHVYLRGDTDRIDEPIEVVGADGELAQVWALPFLMAGALDWNVSSQVEAMDEGLRRIRAVWDADKAQVLVAHCFVREGKVSDSERTLVGTATQIDPEVFVGFDYVALGHLHQPQKAGPNARYSGSIARYSFSEVGHDKSIAEVEVRRGAPHRFVLHPLRCLRGMRRLTDSLDALCSDPKYADMLDDYVELTLDPPVDIGNPMGALNQRWNHVLSLHNELDMPGAALASAPDRPDGTRDLAVDFADFHRQFATPEALSAEVLDAFATLHLQLAAKEVA